eukprot:CAMPEP_0202080300 /NCGR_PEP_ID=MMETSP0964-20121228/7696_1 /ASSEMBLY_ACC=CAM_ASM_000500 /TAXON_ID=4773 /ORGANISM="Schizochytrium aggregatum, Strain ATCC28209" /LENGTH=47 /DNA_ID= /DNA_START= /DNA_END= /DNA_ORIENTATION=
MSVFTAFSALAWPARSARGHESRRRHATRALTLAGNHHALAQHPHAA